MEKIEQQIYASLALEGLKPGHHTHAKTPGIDGASRDRYESICNRWGVYESGSDFARALVQVPLWEVAPPPGPPSHHLVILTTDQGRDSGGRPGAMLRHILRVPAARYAALEYHPFRLLEQGVLLDTWTPETPLVDIDLTRGETDAVRLQQIFPERFKVLRILLGQLLATGDLRFPAASDSLAIEEYFDELITLVPLSRRPSLSLASFAFRSPADFQMVAYHQPEASFRETLNVLQSGSVAALGPPIDHYLSDLFGALSQGDGAAAQDLIRSVQLPESTAQQHPLAVAPVVAAAPAAPSPTPQSTPAHSGRDDEDSLLDDIDDPPQHHPGSRAGGTERTGRGGFPWARVTAAIAAVAAVWLLVVLLRGGGGGESGSDRGDPLDRLIDLHADGADELIDAHERLLGRIVTTDARDLEAREAMTAAAASLPGRVDAAVQADNRNLDRRLNSLARGTDGLGWGALADSVSAIGAQTGHQAARLQRLMQLLSAAEPAALRDAFVDSTGRVHLAAATGSENAAGEVLARRITALADAEAGLRELADANGDDGGDDGWATGAVQLLAAADQLQAEGGTDPRLLRASADVGGAVADLLRQEDPATLARSAAAVPYATDNLRRDPVAGTIRSLESGLRRLRSADVDPDGRVRQLLAFHDALDEIAPDGLAGRSAANGREVLERLVAGCTPPAALPCGDGHGRHLARWKLEAWRALGGPGTADGRDALAALGEASLPEADRAALVAMLDLMPGLERAGQSSPDLIQRVTATARDLDPGLYRTICEQWLARHQREEADKLGRFAEQYAVLCGRLEQFRQADAATAPAAFARLQGALDDVHALGLQSLDGDAETRRRIDAVRALTGSMNARYRLRVARIDLEILRNRDYGGDLRSEARPRLVISRAFGTTLDPIFDRQLPALPAAAGAGFEPYSLRLNTALLVRADDRLLIVGRDEDGAVWFHHYVERRGDQHIAEALAGLHEAQATRDVMETVAARPDGPYPHSPGGQTVATLNVVLVPGFWEELGNSLPALP